MAQAQICEVQSSILGGYEQQDVGNIYEADLINELDHVKVMHTENPPSIISALRFMVHMLGSKILTGEAFCRTLQI